MPGTRVIQFRCTKEQYERIQIRKQALGYIRLSDFFRDLALREDLATYKILKEIHAKLIGEDIDGKSKNCIPR